MSKSAALIKSNSSCPRVKSLSTCYITYPRSNFGWFLVYVMWNIKGKFCLRERKEDLDDFIGGNQRYDRSKK